MKFKDRLEKLKNSLKDSSQEKLIFLMNPKDTRVMEGLVAWKNMKIEFDPYIDVSDDASIEDLWRLVSFSNKEYAVCLGVSVSDSLPRFRQLKQMSMIFPDGSIDEMCYKLMMTYLKRQLGKVLQTEKE